MESRNITLRDAYSGRFLTNCQIKIFNEQDKPLMVEFIQLPIPKYGTTVTNTISSLAKQEIKNLKNKVNQVSFINLLQESLSLDIKDTIFHLLKSLCIGLYKKNLKIKNIIWIEHYPANTYFFKYDKYAIITFDKSFNEPEWEHLSLKELSERTGYAKSDFQTIK